MSILFIPCYVTMGCLILMIIAILRKYKALRIGVIVLFALPLFHVLVFLLCYSWIELRGLDNYVPLLINP